MDNKDKSIIISNVCKKYKNKIILNNISFNADPGKVTAFLGPNGAGKSSTLRILLGLDRSTSGEAVFGGLKYNHLTYPLKLVGASFDGVGGTPSRSVIMHLKIIAKSNGISNKRIFEVLDTVQLSNKVHAKLSTLSLGEGQRLGIATALLGDPQYLIFDEPTNGLDPQGIKWFRNFVKDQARCGKTILLSSHYLSEIEDMADDVVIISKGEVVAAGKLEDIMPELETLEEVFFNLTGVK